MERRSSSVPAGTYFQKRNVPPHQSLCRIFVQRPLLGFRLSSVGLPSVLPGLAVTRVPSSIAQRKNALLALPSPVDVGIPRVLESRKVDFRNRAYGDDCSDIQVR
jgi:hypothetical protein